ncbi:MAG: ATP-binding protein, partial [Bradymonadaceae bacterium]
AYWMDVSVRGVTAVASMGTALMLFPLIPKAVSLAHGAKAAHTRGIKLETMVDELATAYEKTREIEQLKSDFFANVSHELRTPLSLIIGPSEEIAHAENLTDKQRRDMGVILRNARGLLLHVNDLLDVASLDAGRLEIKRSDHADIRHIVALQASNFETLADANDIDFQVDLPETLTGRVDEEKIGRVVLNLLSNAFKFTPKGGKIRCTLFTRNGDVVLEVADSGPGIPVKNREQVFERFRQLEGGSTRRFGGTGLGLVIVKDFVELHGGTIRIDDAPEGGALLVMELPATVTGSEAETSPEFEPITPAITPPTEELPPQTDEIATDAPLILIVEDNPEMNRFVSEALAADYRVLCAHDGAEGLKMTLEHRPDLIISDVMMPVMSGDQFVRAVRTHAEFDDMPIIMLTAKADDEMRITLLREGAQDYVMKPFSV